MVCYIWKLDSNANFDRSCKYSSDPYLLIHVIFSKFIEIHHHRWSMTSLFNHLDADLEVDDETHLLDLHQQMKEQLSWFNLLLLKTVAILALFFLRPVGYFLAAVVVLYILSFTRIDLIKLLPTVAAFGIFLPKVSGVLSGQEGVNYYAEIHQSRWNSWVHTIFMPFTYGGFNLAVPALLSMPARPARRFRWLVFGTYVIHYASINILVALLVAYFYTYVIRFANTLYDALTHRQSVFWGLAVSVTALIIQEVIGHWWGGDPASRPEGVGNAILYAVFYSMGISRSP